MTWAKDPSKWHGDADVQAYGALLGQRESHRQAFAAAVAKLRLREDIPADLRASAGRILATEHFRQAVQLVGKEEVSFDTPWPASREESLTEVSRACEVFDQALVESTEVELCARLAVVCPEWPAAVAAGAITSSQARKLRLEMRLQEAAWVAHQASFARTVADSARVAASGAPAPAAGQSAADALRKAGLPEAKEEELWARAVALVEQALKESEQEVALPEGVDDGDEALVPLRARGRLLLVTLLKDLAIAEGRQHRLKAGSRHLLRALELALAVDGLKQLQREQMTAAGEGMLQLLKRDMLAQASTKGEAEELVQLSSNLAGALMTFAARCT